jgi:hypothetical protein
MSRDAVIVHVGYHKTGHQWVRDALFEERAAGYGLVPKDSVPVRRLVRDRPLDFDAAAIRRELEPLIDEQRGAGLVPVICWGRLAGQAYSGGYDAKEMGNRLHAVLPEARILVVIREQRAIILSTYKQYVTTGGVCSLEHFLHPATDGTPRVPGFDFGYFEYDRLLRHYQSLYGSGSVLALPFELLAQDRAAFVRRIAELAERPLADDVLERVVNRKATNRAKTAFELTLMRRLNRFGPRTELNPAPMVDVPAIFALRDRMPSRRKLRTMPGTRTLVPRVESRLREAVAKAVGDRYVESNRSTAELTGADLGSLGWMV